MVNLSDIRRGSVVLVRPAFGTLPAVEAEVTNVLADIKNGKPGIDYRVIGVKGKNWAYLNQVDRVVTY